MRIRPVRKGEIETLQANSKMAYDKAGLPELFEDAFVLEDQNGVARAVFMAERVAEIYLLVDHDWETPAMRMETLRVGAEEMRRRLEAKGFRAAYAYFDDAVPQGWIRRLVKFAGAQVQKRIVRFAHGRT